ncbi:glutathione S-transferase [Phaeosphaeria sp. MPI-PUGE-AT-0046c]|nr:glutathione S-transferase [Phaeosphaeria sp. MPI-PUGE-AT-0046c]
MAATKPIVLHGVAGPNPVKVRMLIEELGIPYEIKEVSFADVKGPEFIAINPNGRMPAIYDPNTDLTLWESGAIIEYLIEKYDTKRTLSFEPSSNEAWLAKQWLYFQTTGQGPYYGQAVWFTKFHPEQIESAKQRYHKEIQRVTSVLEAHLKTQSRDADGPWLVGGKFSYADLAFVPWQNYAAVLTDVAEYTEVSAWLEKLKAKAGIKKVLDLPAAH